MHFNCWKTGQFVGEIINSTIEWSSIDLGCAMCDVRVCVCINSIRCLIDPKIHKSYGIDIPQILTRFSTHRCQSGKRMRLSGWHLAMPFSQLYWHLIYCCDMARNARLQFPQSTRCCTPVNWKLNWTASGDGMSKKKKGFSLNLCATESQIIWCGNW